MTSDFVQRKGPSGPENAASGGGIVPPAGQLDGTTLHPTVVGITESGGQELDIDSIPDGTFLKRVGALIVGVAVAAGVSSFNGRTGAVVPATGDYAASDIGNDSSVTGAHVSDALNTLNTSLASLVPTSRTISTTAPLSGGGDLSANRTLTVATASNTSSGVVPQTNGTLGQALLSASGAGALTWGTNFGANDLITTGSISLGTTPAASGNIRIPHGGTLVAKSNGGSDTTILSWGVGTNDQLRLLSIGGSYRISTSGQQDTFIGATRQYSLGSGQLLFAPDAAVTWSLSLLTTVEIQFYVSGSIRNMSFFGQINAAGWDISDRCMYIVTATTAPTINPTGGVYFYVEPTTSSLIWRTPGGTMAIGTTILATTVTGAANSALVGTSNCLRWSTGNLGFYNTSPVAQASRVGQLTDSTTGTPGTTINDGGGAYSQATTNNNNASLLAKINAIELAIHNIGLTA